MKLSLSRLSTLIVIVALALSACATTAPPVPPSAEAKDAIKNFSGDDVPAFKTQTTLMKNTILPTRFSSLMVPDVDGFMEGWLLVFKNKIIFLREYGNTKFTKELDFNYDDFIEFEPGQIRVSRSHPVEAYFFYRTRNKERGAIMIKDGFDSAGKIISKEKITEYLSRAFYRY